MAGFEIRNLRMPDIVVELSPAKAVKTFYTIFDQNVSIPVLAREGEMSTRMLLMASYSTELLDKVDCVGFETSMVDVVLLTEKFFKTVKVALLDALRYEAEDLEDVEWVMKHAGANGKSATARFADALEASDFYRNRIEKVMNNKAQLLQFSRTCT